MQFPSARGLCLAVVGVCMLAGSVRGQGPRDHSAADNHETGQGIFLPADRRTLQKLSDARTQLAEGRHGESVRALGAILESPEDFFFHPEAASQVRRSLKSEACRLIGALPPEGREMYELQYGARARQALDAALNVGDMTAVADVSRRFFHTRSGYQALLLVGLDHFDRGRPLAGAMALERLRAVGQRAEQFEPALSLTLAACWLHAGQPDRAQQVLIDWRKGRPTLRVAFAGRETPIFSDDAKAIPWLTDLVGSAPRGAADALDDWRMFGGNPERVAPSAGGAPMLSLRWRAPLCDDALAESALDHFRRQLAEQDAPPAPALQALAVGDVILARTDRRLLAVDFSTGKRLWAAPSDDPETQGGLAPADEMQARRMMLWAGLGLRIGGDMTYGALSSDGRRVFAVESSDLSFGPGGNLVFRFGGIDGGEAAASSNRLAAYAIRTGKLAWELGGPSGPDALPLAETFFLGPPLPLGDQLYVLGEIKGEVRLLALDGSSGKLIWSQQLAMVDSGAAQSPLRRMAGASPSYADGVLVCPTAAGALVGIELSTRWLLWGYGYGAGRSGQQQPAMMPVVAGPPTVRWLDAAARIVGGRVLVTPVEADALYCLNLSDGALLWKNPRQNDWFIACADRDRVVLAGRRGLRALRMSDGRSDWKGRPVALPEGTLPGGRGFLCEGLFWLPLDDGRLVAVDVAEGRITQTIKPRGELSAGNLVCHRDQVISLGWDGLTSYRQRESVREEAARRLAANPDDAEALSLRGETLLDEGRRAEAVASFRRAYALSAQPRAGRLLRDALLDGLREDFAAYRDRAGELDRLLADPADRATYLRLMTDGLLRIDRVREALDQLLEAFDLPLQSAAIDAIDAMHSARRDAWFRGRLASIEEKADSATLSALAAAVGSLARAALDDGSEGRLARFLDFFGDQPQSAPVRAELIKKHRAAGRSFEAEWLEDDSSSDAPRDRETPWSLGAVEISTSIVKRAAADSFGRYVVERRGDGGPPDATIRFDNARRMLIASDGWGRPTWQVPVSADDQRRHFGFDRSMAHARWQGRVLLVALGTNIMAIDSAASPRRSGASRLLWSQDLAEPEVAPTGPGPVQLAMANVPWPWQRQFAPSRDRSELLAPRGARYVCFRRSRTLVAVDSLSGRTLWIRRDVPAESELLGDDRYILVLSPERPEAMLLRAADGQLLGLRPLPRTPMRGKTVHSGLRGFSLGAAGRRIVLWSLDGAGRELALLDPLEGRDQWKTKWRFSESARACRVGDESVGVFEPQSGRFVLIAISDGRAAFDATLQPEPTATDIALMHHGNCYYLLVRAAPPDGKPTLIQPVAGGDPTPIHRGRLYALDGQGRSLWPKPTEIGNQFLLQEQPSRLPVLVFAAQRYEQQAAGRGRQSLSLFVVDKRNGRVALKKTFHNYAGVLNVQGDPESHAVDLLLQRHTIRMKFTDKPLPPEAPEDRAASDAPPRDNPARALWDSIQKKLGEMIEGESSEEESP